MSECGIQCIFSIILVGFIWGATNPLIRAASVKAKDAKKSDDGGDGISGMIKNFLKSFLDWRFSVPFGLNQSASILFNVLVVNFPVTIVVPCVNAMQLLSTAIVGTCLGEEIGELSRRQAIGMAMTVFAIIGMLLVE